VIGRRYDKQGRFASHDPVRRGCDQSQIILNAYEMGSAEMSLYEVK